MAGGVASTGLVIKEDGPTPCEDGRYDLCVCVCVCVRGWDGWGQATILDAPLNAVAGT